MDNCHFVLAVAREPFGLRVQFVGLREAPEHQRSARKRLSTNGAQEFVFIILYTRERG